MSGLPNVLFITLDQFRGDSLSCAGHPLVRTPNLDALAGDGLRLARHYAQAAPCGPGRAALYTGTYMMTNRVVDNGTPLDDRFDNIARAARRAGYEPALFGYTDQAPDPRAFTDPDDARLSNWQGVLPGFDPVLELDDYYTPWMSWLTGLGYDVDDVSRALASESVRPVEHSLSAFQTDHLIRWIDRQTGPWFAHASYLRPHPPYNAAGEFATMYDPADCPDPLPVPERRHPLLDELLADRSTCAPAKPGAVAAVRSQYYGMISEVDCQLGRVWECLRGRGDWDNTLIVVTADHADQLGDQGLRQKLGFFESSYRILGIVRDPSALAVRGAVVDQFTENVDLFPTVCDAVGIPVPQQCDGYPLTPFLHGDGRPDGWRQAAHYEWDWRHRSGEARRDAWPWDRQPERDHLAVLRSTDRAYVQFGDGSWRCFDTATDPTWGTEIDDLSIVLGDAQEMLLWRSHHTERPLDRPRKSFSG